MYVQTGIHYYVHFELYSFCLMLEWLHASAWETIVEEMNEGESEVQMY